MYCKIVKYDIKLEKHTKQNTEQITDSYNNYLQFSVINNFLLNVLFDGERER